MPATWSIDGQVLMSHIHSKERLAVKKGKTDVSIVLYYGLMWDECLHPCVSVCNSNTMVPTGHQVWFLSLGKAQHLCSDWQDNVVLGEVATVSQGKQRHRLASQALFTGSTGSWDRREAGRGLTCLQPCVWRIAARKAFSQDKCCMYWRDPVEIKAWATSYQKWPALA